MSKSWGRSKIVAQRNDIRSGQCNYYTAAEYGNEIVHRLFRPRLRLWRWLFDTFWIFKNMVLANFQLFDRIYMGSISGIFIPVFIWSRCNCLCIVWFFSANSYPEIFSWNKHVIWRGEFIKKHPSLNSRNNVD